MENNSPELILKERLARGEINIEEFRALSEELGLRKAQSASTKNVAQPSDPEPHLPYQSSKNEGSALRFLLEKFRFRKMPFVITGALITLIILGYMLNSNSIGAILGDFIGGYIFDPIFILVLVISILGTWDKEKFFLHVCWAAIVYGIIMHLLLHGFLDSETLIKDLFIRLIASFVLSYVILFIQLILMSKLKFNALKNSLE